MHGLKILLRYLFKFLLQPPAAIVGTTFYETEATRHNDPNLHWSDPHLPRVTPHTVTVPVINRFGYLISSLSSQGLTDFDHQPKCCNSRGLLQADQM